MNTLNSRLTDAAICRVKRWKPGTILEGTEYYVNGASTTTRIRITAIGENGILARAIEEDGRRYDGYENLWTLRCREWKKVKS